MKVEKLEMVKKKFKVKEVSKAKSLKIQEFSNVKTVDMTARRLKTSFFIKKSRHGHSINISVFGKFAPARPRIAVFLADLAIHVNAL